MVRFSLIASAIRSGNYENCYNSISFNNHTSFEMVYAGHVPSTKKMPDNFRYIISDEHPACCLEIASRSSNGEYLITTADDLEYSKNFLDILSQNIDEYRNEKVFFTGLYKWDHHVTYPEGRPLRKKNCINSPNIFLYFCLKKEVWNSIGGIDKRFHSYMCDTDLQLRLFEHGYRCVIVKNIYVNEIGSHNVGKRLCSRMHKQGETLMYNFWIKDSMFSDHRMSQLQSFSDKILNNSKEWKFNE